MNADPKLDELAQKYREAMRVHGTARNRAENAHSDWSNALRGQSEAYNTLESARTALLEYIGNSAPVAEPAPVDGGGT